MKNSALAGFPHRNTSPNIAENLTMNQLNPDDYDVLSFDCYGTLVDWQGAIVTYMQRVLLSHDVHVFDGTILEFFAQWEPLEQDVGGTYSEVLTRVMTRYGHRLGFTPTEDESEGFVDAVATSNAFPDTESSLQILKSKFDLAIISNTDEELIKQTLEPLGVEFEEIVTAQELGCYKPNRDMLLAAIERITSGNKRLLHVAQSPFHDIKPMVELGYDCVWIKRETELGSAVQAVDIKPNWTFDTLGEFVSVVSEDSGD